MTELTAKIIMTGNTWAVRIPKALIDCKVLDPAKPVRVMLVQDEKDGPGGICHKNTFLDQWISEPLDPLVNRGEAL